MCIIGKRGQDIYIKTLPFSSLHCLLLIGQYLIKKKNKTKKDTSRSNKFHVKSQNKTYLARSENVVFHVGCIHF